MGRLSKIAIILSCFLFLNTYLSANTIVVEPNNPQKSIKKAFETAKNGDTILIKEGIYQEGELILNKRVNIKGEGLPIIDGEHKHEILLIAHDSVTIEGVKVINSGSSNFNDIAALKIKDSNYVTVENCIFENNFFGIDRKSTRLNSSHVAISYDV